MFHTSYNSRKNMSQINIATRNVVIFSLAFLIVLTAAIGCSRAKRDWNQAQKKGTINWYEAFLARHPDSEFSQKALEEIWRLTVEQNAMDTYESFLKKHPDSQFSQKALEGIWKLTAKQDSMDAYESFLGRHPNSEFSQNALEGIWKLTVKKNTIDAYEYFLSKYPSSPYFKRANTNMIAIWALVVPPKPQSRLRSDMTVDVSWERVPKAESYVVYWSSQASFRKEKSNSRATSQTQINHKEREGTYGAKLPMYYRVAAVKWNTESRLSDACVADLLPHEGGDLCQICGDTAVGYCHLRHVYVCQKHNTFTDDEGTHWRCP